MEVNATVKGVESSGRMAVKLTFVDFWEKLIWKYLYYWAPVDLADDPGLARDPQHRRAGFLFPGMERLQVCLRWRYISQ